LLIALSIVVGTIGREIFREKMLANTAYPMDIGNERGPRK